MYTCRAASCLRPTHTTADIRHNRPSSHVILLTFSWSTGTKKGAKQPPTSHRNFNLRTKNTIIIDCSTQILINKNRCIAFDSILPHKILQYIHVLITLTSLLRCTEEYRGVSCTEDSTLIWEGKSNSMLGVIIYW